MKISITNSAKKFINKWGIEDVTFHLKEIALSGCCVGIVKEIEPIYKCVEDATAYRYYEAEGTYIFISRDIRVLGPLTLTTEGFWKLRRLALEGASVPL